MSKRAELIEKYALDLTEKCGIVPDLELLAKVVIGCGPAIYNKDSAMVSGSSEKEIQIVKTNFLIKKLGLKDGAPLEKGIDKVLTAYGRSNKNKYRAVVYYLLVLHFKKEKVYR